MTVQSIIPLGLYIDFNNNIEYFHNTLIINNVILEKFISFFTISNAQAYATVGAASVLGTAFYNFSVSFI